MFLFGDPAEAAKMQVEMHLNSGGPRVPEVHFDEMEEQDLLNFMAYLYGALNSALLHGQDDAIVEVLREWYDELFVALLEASDMFRDNVLRGFVSPPGGPKVRRKYMELAMKASAS